MRIKHTQNKSFIDAWRILQDLSCTDANCMMELNDSYLDEMEDDSGEDVLISDKRLALGTEVQTNIWYFFREYIKIPSLMDRILLRTEGNPYNLIAGNFSLVSLILIRAYTLHLNIIFCVNNKYYNKTDMAYLQVIDHLHRTLFLLENYDMLMGNDMAALYITKELVPELNYYVYPHIDYSENFPQGAFLAKSFQIRNEVEIPSKDKLHYMELITNINKSFRSYLHFDKKDYTGTDVRNLFSLFLTLQKINTLRHTNLPVNKSFPYSSIYGFIPITLFDSFRQDDLSGTWFDIHGDCVDYYLTHECDGQYGDYKGKDSEGKEGTYRHDTKMSFIRSLFSEEFSNNIIPSAMRNTFIFIKL